MKRTIYQTPMHSRLIGLTLAAVLCAGLSQTTYGANLLVNPGFDYTTNGDGSAPNNVAGTVDPVTSYLYGAGVNPTFNSISPISTTNNGTAQFLGWNGGGNASAQTLDSSSFGGTLPTGAVGYANAGFSLTQTLTGELQALTTYTLNVDIYSRTDYQPFTGYSPVVVQLQDGSSTFLAGTNGPGDVGVTETPFANSMGHVTVTFTTGAGQSVDNLIVNLGSIVGGGAQVSFDNATLTALTVPEPGSLVLLTCSAVGIFLVARRRNRPQK